MAWASATNEDLIRDVEERLGLCGMKASETARILTAMRAVDRAHFLSPGQRNRAYDDNPAPIGLGQTCSQPSMVAIMLGALEPREGQRLLEIGSGCGYAAAIAAALVGPEGHVYACELLPELLAKARANCATTALRGWPLSSIMTFIEGDGSAGFPEKAPFDRILVSAGVHSQGFSADLLTAQLAEDGILVYPETHGRLHRVKRRGQKFLRSSWGCVAFVPLKGRNSGLPANGTD